MKARSVCLTIACLVTAAFPSAVKATGSCDGGPAGGEWATYGNGLDNTRSQPCESVINTSTVANLHKAWAFQVSAQPGVVNGGSFSNTPTVAGGRVYMGTDSGWILAANQSDGSFLWKQHVDGGAPGALVGGIIVGSITVADDVAYVGVSRANSPYVVAYDAADGHEMWRTTVADGFSTFISSAPVVFNGLLFQGIAGYEGNSDARGGYAILNVGADPTQPIGSVLQFRWTIDDHDYALGYRGASIWGTPAADPVGKYVYAGGGNPASKKIEHEHSNALLKIDVDPSRPTFGDIVDAFKGNSDQYYPGLERQPACDLFGEDAVYLAWSAACLQLDLDFGAAPNLFRASDGKLMVGDLQKSGVYHAVYASTMEEKWSTIVGAPCFACNATSSAVDGENVYAYGTPGGSMVSFTRDFGKYRWATPIVDGIHFQSVSTANGVVYVLDGEGALNALDASNGAPLMRHPLMLDTDNNSTSDGGGSSGISIAGNTVFAAQGEYVVAFRP